MEESGAARVSGLPPSLDPARQQGSNQGHKCVTWVDDKFVLDTQGIKLACMFNAQDALKTAKSA